MRVSLSASAVLANITGRDTVFSEQAQELLELDELSAYLGHLLTSPRSFKQLQTDLMRHGASRMRAVASLMAFLELWSGHGLLNFVLDDDDGRPLLSSVIGLPGLAVDIAYHDQRVLERILPVFRHLVSPGVEPSACYNLVPLGRRVCIFRDYSKGVIVTPSQAAPALKALLTEDVLASVGTKIALHAAWLVNGVTGVMLCGSPGAGKSTLALALHDAGFDYGGDDIALMDSAGFIRGVPFAPTLKAGSWNLLGASRDAIESCCIHRRLDGRRVRYVAPIRYAQPAAFQPTRILLLNRRREGPVVLSQVDPMRVLSELLSGAFTPTGRLSATQFKSLVGALSKARLFNLTFSRLDEAVEAVVGSQ